MKASQEIIIKGIGGSPGICIGKAYLVDKEGVDVVHRYYLLASELDSEIERFKQAVEQAMQEMDAIIASVPAEFSEQLDILEAHKVLLKDKKLYDKTCKMIESKNINAEWALKIVSTQIYRMFNEMTDPYFRERGADVAHVTNRIMRNLMGNDDHEQIQNINKRVILIAHDLSPSETSQIQLHKIQGFITELGGKTSHTSIIARTLQVPAILGLKSATDIIPNDSIIIVDGTMGTVILNPSEDSLIEYEEKKSIFERRRKFMMRHSEEPAQTPDGIQKKVMGNIEMLEEVVSVLDHGGDGIGLYRTEFLYMARNELPSEEQLFENYKEVVDLMYPHPVTIRTLDINGDKQVGILKECDETNPVLGLRAIRYCLKRPDIFKIQLRAILRAAAFGNVRLMFPMISGVKEIVDAKKILQETIDQLTKKKVPFNAKIDVGIMIEVPSAAILSDILADHVDFFSIGTNDLIQYSLAIDRGNHDVAHLFQPLHPAIIRLVKYVSESAHNKGVKLFMCGEMAADPFYVPILLALGIDEFSMNPPSIPAVKNIIRQISTDNMAPFLDRILAQKSPDDIIQIVQDTYGALFKETIR
ncbi:MAG: phosphotransferase system, enzyme I, PtsI [Candidatus Magnetoglobus multicellularis str. Araruama]|uniref:Phosphoenolpyruvate-protein phosphotransferase n=1 Tax=Candidatus Magnetoglobus multicellularis str. Araruama TaxID=890399 RepID=A0A1V1P4R1_9BACT|nr:MAG: phosphotransferase system, enzyme I, PtsI [Candidatus Magnetoglobus multicellularis str. Araruama]